MTKKLNEVSKALLARYVGQASVDKSFRAQDVESVNAKARTHGTTAADRKFRDDANRKHGNRSGGIGLAVNKIAGFKKGGKHHSWARVHATEETGVNEDTRADSLSDLHAKFRHHIAQEAYHVSRQDHHLGRAASVDRRLPMADSIQQQHEKMAGWHGSKSYYHQESAHRALGMIERLGGHVSVHEAIEEGAAMLDEISKKSVANYVSRANDDANYASYFVNKRANRNSPYSADEKREQKRHFKNVLRKRTRGLGLAANTLAREDVEQVDEISKDLAARYVKKAADTAGVYAYTAGAGHARSRDDGKKLRSWRKADNRIAGIKRATDRLAREDVEQVDEISKDLVHRYLRKAVDSYGKLEFRAGRHISDDKATYDKANRRAERRQRGVHAALKKVRQ